MPLTSELQKVQEEIRGYAVSAGLDFFEVLFELLDWNQMNMVASYGGFPNRYPHWRFGMEYERLSKSYAYGLSKIYEMVINNDPCYAYLLHSNNIVDQKMVMAHVYAHSDFFKNSVYFSQTNRKMIDEMANHRTRVLRLIDRHGIDVVESFIDCCLSLENLIDTHLLTDPLRKRKEPKPFSTEIHRLKSKPYMEKFINPPEFLEAEQQRMAEEVELQRKIPLRPEKDVLRFLLEAAPLEHWEADLLSIVREEGYYFAPQGQTKILNEGWACVVGNTLVVTEKGLMTMKEIVEQRQSLWIFDGKNKQKVIDFARFEKRKTFSIRTQRGLELEGSNTHQIFLADRSWKSLEDLNLGDRVLMPGESFVWPEKLYPLHWQIEKRMTLNDVAKKVGVHLSTVIRHRAGLMMSQSAAAMEAWLIPYEQQLKSLSFSQNSRQEICIPKLVDESLASFLGYLVGDGNISIVKRVTGLTTGDKEQAETFAQLVQDLFHLTPRIKKDDNRFRVLISSQHLNDFLVSLGLTTGPSAREKTIPDCILRSPKKVMAAFLRALFDCDGYAGPAGVILSTSSTIMSKLVQIVLLHFGILSARRSQAHDIWNVQMMGQSVQKFMDEIGFGLKRKQIRLREYVENRKWFKEEKWEDEIVEIKEGVADVYDVTVENSHCYAAHGFINHNSYWHSKTMTEKALHPSEIIDYADHHSGTVCMQPGQINPYKIGIELLRDVEDRWNRGRFGKEYDECTDMRAKRHWDHKTGIGRQKIFEIRKLYNDVMFIDEFLTPEFCAEHKMFVYAFNVSADQYEIVTREFEKVKKQLLFQLTNMGNPIIHVVDANYKNRSELLLKHAHEGIDLRLDWARETLKALHRVWKHPVHIETILEGTPKLFSFDGSKHEESRP